jgi:hypothetical protein
MNEYYTNRDITDFKEIEPKYKLSNKIEGEDAPIIDNSPAVALNGKYYLSTYDRNLDLPNITEILHKTVDLKADITFYTTLENESFYFGHLLRDTILEYEAYTDLAHTIPLRDNSITLLGDPTPPEEYNIEGYVR